MSSSGIIITIVIVAVLAAICIYSIKKYRKNLESGCCGTGDDGPGELVEPEDKDESHYPYHAEITIGGMHCENCARTITNAMNRIDGVWGKVDLNTNKATVLYKNEKLLRQIRMAVAANGFTIEDVT